MSNIFLQKIKGVIAKEFNGARHPQQGGASTQQQFSSNTGNGNQGQFYGDSGTQQQYSNQQQYYGSDSSQQQAYTGYGNQQQYNDPSAQQSYAGYGGQQQYYGNNGTTQQQYSTSTSTSTRGADQQQSYDGYSNQQQYYSTDSYGSGQGGYGGQQSYADDAATSIDVEQQTLNDGQSSVHPQCFLVP